MTSFYQSLTVNTDVSHVVYVRAEGAYLRNFSEIKKVRGKINFHGLSYYIVIEASALTFWIIAINQVTISIQVSLLFSCLLQQSLLPTRKLGL